MPSLLMPSKSPRLAMTFASVPCAVATLGSMTSISSSWLATPRDCHDYPRRCRRVR